jgi:predicted Fe-Mo cluster-binding NifX family protein
MLRNMTREEQMVYVEKHLAPFKGRLKNLGDVYMAIHWPKAVGKSDDYVMYTDKTEYYDPNKKLDVNEDGVITRGEALQEVMAFNAGGSAAGQITATSLGSTNGGNANPEAEATAPAQPTDNSNTPEGISATVVDAMQIADAGAVAATREDPSIVDREAPEQPAQPEKGKTVSRALDSQAIANMVASKLSPSDLRKLRAAGVRPEEVEYFKDQAEAEAALAAGEVSKGTVYITETGNIFMLE